MRMRILAISGSLRAASSNSRLIAALALLAPAGVTLSAEEIAADPLLGRRLLEALSAFASAIALLSPLSGNGL